MMLHNYKINITSIENSYITTELDSGDTQTHVIETMVGKGLEEYNTFDFYISPLTYGKLKNFMLDKTHVKSVEYTILFKCSLPPNVIEEFLRSGKRINVVEECLGKCRTWDGANTVGRIVKILDNAHE